MILKKKMNLTIQNNIYQTELMEKYMEENILNLKKM